MRLHYVYSACCSTLMYRPKKWQTEHRTATTAYPCYLPVLGEFSRSWSCRLAGRKDRRLSKTKTLLFRNLDGDHERTLSDSFGWQSFTTYDQAPNDRKAVFVIICQ